MNINRLLDEIRNEDSEEAFRLLFDQQYERFFRVAFYFLQRDEWAEEVALDVLAELWNNRHAMVIPDDFARYSFVLVRNEALNYWKREQRYLHDEMEEGTDTEPQSAGLDQQLENDELFAVYEEALAQLPDRCREVWIGIKEDGLTYAQLAEKMGVSTKTIDAQMQKAVKYLRARVGEYMEEEKHIANGTKNFFSLFLMLA